MKKNIFNGSLFFIFLIVACTKDKKIESASSQNYIDEYLGDYNFIVKSHSFSLLDSSTTDSTFYYTGKIGNVDPKVWGPESNRIAINYLINITIEPILEENGSLSGLTKLTGKFESKDKLIFTYSYGGMGGGTTDSVTGERK